MRYVVLAEATYSCSFFLRKQNFSMSFAQNYATKHNYLPFQHFLKKMRALDLKVSCYVLHWNLLLCSILQDHSTFVFPPESLISFCSINWSPSLCSLQNIKRPPASKTGLYKRRPAFTISSRHDALGGSCLEWWSEDLHKPTPKLNNHN